ncbi:MAG TPA: TIGR03790 family protein, partial [Bryobacteraceae bacterium]|nr:TIGR03790 family protein [Bryobacteraceae bacterium]
LYIVTTLGMPLRIDGAGGMTGDRASVDSELTLLYRRLKTAKPLPAEGPLANPFYEQREVAFSHPRFAIYLVTRLAGYSVADAKALVSRCRTATNRGRFVIDSGTDATGGNAMLERAARLLPGGRVLLDASPAVLYGIDNVIGYASWGSNDPGRKRRYPGFRWLPGGIMTEFVSTNARTFQRPPDKWKFSDWNSPHSWFAGTQQSLSADYVAEGVSGASGHVYEPYLTLTARPDFLLPAWADGRNLAESYYLSMPALSWQNIVLGDPLCSLGKP